jgi:hypothetical protein
MTKPKRFDTLSKEEVHQLSTLEKMKYFGAVQTKHRIWDEVVDDLAILLTPHTETSIIVLIGATGVGKTTLLKLAIGKIYKEQEPDVEPGTIPYILIPAPANGSKSLSWTALYRQMLTQAREPLLNKKYSVEEKDGVVTLHSYPHKTLPALRESLEEMLTHRKVKLVVIDEAVHLLRFGEYSAVMDTLKSLSKTVGPKLLLAGSYNLFDLATNYGQVARRAEIVHFGRYLNEKTDVKEFKEAVTRLQDKWPCKEVPSFSNISKELMEASLGCMGVLKGILLNFLSLQLKHNGKWEPGYLAKAAKSRLLLETMRKEIEEGEAKVFGATYGESLFSGPIVRDIEAKMRGAPQRGAAK